MRGIILIFAALTILSGALGLTGVLTYDVTMPVMFLFLGLTMLASAKEKFDRGAKQQARLFVGVTVIIYVILGYNLLMMTLGK